MKSLRRFNRAGMILSMVIGMIIAACMSPAAGPEIVESDEAAAPVMQEEMQTTLSIVQDRGKLVCISNALLPGFGFLDSEGNFSGFRRRLLPSDCCSNLWRFRRPRGEACFRQGTLHHPVQR